MAQAQTMLEGMTTVVFIAFRTPRRSRIFGFVSTLGAAAPDGDEAIQRAAPNADVLRSCSASLELFAPFYASCEPFDAAAIRPRHRLDGFGVGTDLIEQFAVEHAGCSRPARVVLKDVPSANTTSCTPRAGTKSRIAERPRALSAALRPSVPGANATSALHRQHASDGG